jgi:general stress protein CsbA
MGSPLLLKALFKTQHIAPFLLVLLFASVTTAQSVLIPGDVVVVSANAQDNTLELVPLIDLEKNSTLYLNNGIWNQEEQVFTDGEEIEVVFRSSIAAGTPIIIGEQSNSEEVLTSGFFKLSEKTERVFLYQKDDQIHRFLFGIGWGEPLQDFYGSGIPKVLAENPRTILALGTADNYQYFIRHGASGTADMLLSFVGNRGNWRGNDERSFVGFGTTFNLLKPPVILFDQNLSTAKETDKKATLNVAIYEHDGSKLTVDVVFDSTNSSISREEIKDYFSTEVNFTGLVGNAVYEIEVPLENDDEYEGVESGIFTLRNLSHGQFGDYISHTVLVTDDEIPTMKMEVVEDRDRSVLLLHNLERKAINISNWDIINGDHHFVIPKNSILEIGETLLVFEEGNADLQSLSNIYFELDDTDRGLIYDEGTIQLINSNSKRVSSVRLRSNKDERQEIQSASKEILANNTTNQSTPDLNSSASASSFFSPGWRVLTAEQLKELSNVNDFYTWDQTRGKFVSLSDNNQSLSDGDFGIGYLSEELSSKLSSDKAKQVLNENLELKLSTTDRNSDGIITELEGLNYVVNNSNKAISVQWLQSQLKEELGLNYTPQVFISTSNFNGIKSLHNNDVIASNRAFWIGLNENIEAQTLRLSVDGLNNSTVTEVEEDMRGFSLLLNDGRNSASVEILFTDNDEVSANVESIALYKDLYVNSFRGLALTMNPNLKHYEKFHVSTSLSNVVNLPLKMISTEEGEFTLSVQQWEDIPTGWVIVLEDMETDRVYELTSDWDVDFDYFNENTSSTQELSFPSTEDRFRIKVIPESLVATEGVEDIPTDIELYQNYPNPFNPTTNISFYLLETSEVKLSVFNIVGQPVATLVQTTLSQGEHSVEWDATDMPSGMYIYQLEVGNKVMTRKMTLVK